MRDCCLYQYNPGVHRHGVWWVWHVYNSAYGAAAGRRLTRRGAVRSAQRAAVDLIADDWSTS